MSKLKNAELPGCASFRPFPSIFHYLSLSLSLSPPLSLSIFLPPCFVDYARSITDALQNATVAALIRYMIHVSFFFFFFFKWMDTVRKNKWGTFVKDWLKWNGWWRGGGDCGGDGWKIVWHISRYHLSEIWKQLEGVREVFVKLVWRNLFGISGIW